MRPANTSEAIFLQAACEVDAHGATRKYLWLLAHASAAGSVAAMTDFGMWLLEGRRDARGTILRRSPRQAVALLRRAAAAGNSMAQLALGNCYADGTGVERDTLEAERCFRMAARRGEYYAAFNLATLYRDRSEKRKERRWLRRAATLGAKTAPFILAEIDLVSPRRAAARAARKFLQRKARTASEDLREEAREILEHFERTGRRRWAPDP